MHRLAKGMYLLTLSSAKENATMEIVLNRRLSVVLTILSDILLKHKIGLGQICSKKPGMFTLFDGGFRFDN